MDDTSKQATNKTTTIQAFTNVTTRQSRSMSNKRLDPSQGTSGQESMDAIDGTMNGAGSDQKTTEESELSENDVSTYNHQCYICDKIFSANSNLNRHLRKIHHENVQSPYNNVKCALCDTACPSSSMYISHLRNDHEVQIEIETLNFPNRQTFEDWKYDVENRTMSQFIKSRGEKRTKNINKTYYSCNRSGYYVSKARTQKALKKQGSRKINGRCPASMNVTVNTDSTYDVRFIKTHVGHDFSLKHLDLSEKDRDLIVKKLASGVTKRDIIKQIRTAAELHQLPASNTISPASSVSGSALAISNSSHLLPIVISDRSSLGNSTSTLESSPIDEAVIVTSGGDTLTVDQSAAPSKPSTPIPPNGNGSLDSNIGLNVLPTSRIHLATTKDIHNILNSKNLDSKKIRHNYDLSQLESWINEMKSYEEESSVLLYKNQDETCAQFPKLQADDFILILMKPGQAEMLKEHGSRCVILESTHNVHCEYLHVAYLAIVDEQQKGLPVAFMFSTRTDSDVMEVFFTLLKERVGLVSTRMFIADEQHEFYQAWWRVMSMPLHNLLSPWTVFENWSKKFDLVRVREKLRKLKRQLRMLLNEIEEDKFQRSFRQLTLDYHLDPDVLRYMDWFEANYGKNPEVWSGCLRKNYNVSNYQLTCLHEKFKIVYKEGKNSKKMCKFVGKLMNLFQDHHVEALQRLEENVDLEARKQGVGARHKRSESISLIYEVAVDPVYWLCPVDGSSNDLYYEIRQVISDNPMNKSSAPDDHIDQNKEAAERKQVVRTRQTARSTRRDGLANQEAGGEIEAADERKMQISVPNAGGVFEVQIEEKCCDLNCSMCSCCRHKYECTCLDYVFNLNSCKHIHRICTMSKTWT